MRLSTFLRMYSVNMIVSVSFGPRPPAVEYRITGAAARTIPGAANVAPTANADRNIFRRDMLHCCANPFFIVLLMLVASKIRNRSICAILSANNHGSGDDGSLD